MFGTFWNLSVKMLFFPPPVNPFAPGWKGKCNESVDCEDTTNHNILQVRISV